MKTVSIAHRTPADFEYIPVTALAVFTPTWDTGVFGTATPKAMFVTVEDQSIRYRADDQGTPTTASGHLVTAGESIWFENESAIRNFSMIATTGTAAVFITYYR